jgi:hypothetical protein
MKNLFIETNFGYGSMSRAGLLFTLTDTCMYTCFWYCYWQVDDCTRELG